MAIGVGLRIGRVVSTAVVASNEPGTQDPVVIARDTVLHIDEDGTTTLGSYSSGNEARTLAGFLARVGDPAGVTASDGRVYRAEDAMATAIQCLLNETEPLPKFGGADDGSEPGYTATYPSHWDSDAVASLRAALDYADLRHVDLASDAQGAATWYASEISETPGQLIGVFHIDDAGSTVTLVRSGVPAGKAFRIPTKGAPSPASQLATALGSFGWLPPNLDAVVVMGDGIVARDRSYIQEIANSIATKLMVRTLVGPGPEQTAALGAAILAAGFVPARETKRARIGLPPSYDETDVLTGGLARIRAQEMLEAGKNDVVAARLLAVEPDDEDDREPDTTENDETEKRSRKPLIPIVAGVALVAVPLLVLLL
ncbi:hypothetical protein I0Q12_29060 [Rhodococcus sp. CX]|uniref:hypothetical protein n=1 Tax=Rhodococcus sp. CX TaxID=2789880 RepID=UPI0018CF497D|nr:hypothetical protein [Rhodococcus sp. CX]MBH0123321.1 hypothetical protein [Rhodococcus sp. CX]